MYISVIIPTHNRGSLTCRALDSVLSQSRAADQIIVVDDGSSDDTAEILQHRYGDRIELITQTNQGVSAARNNGIKAARGDWVALLDSDDEWLPGKLAAQQSLLSDHPGSVLCHTEEIWIRNGTRVNPMNKHRKYGGDIFEHCLKMCVMSPSSVLLQTKLARALGGFNPALPACEDYDLWLRICAQYPVLFVEQPQLKKYGGHADQLSRKHWGMDRFRVRALRSLLSTVCLTEKQYSATVEMLLLKTNLLMKGAIKHGNTELINECESILQQTTNISRSTRFLPC